MTHWLLIGAGIWFGLIVLLLAPFVIGWIWREHRDLKAYERQQAIREA